MIRLRSWMKRTKNTHNCVYTFIWHSFVDSIRSVDCIYDHFTLGASTSHSFDPRRMCNIIRNFYALLLLQRVRLVFFVTIVLGYAYIFISCMRQFKSCGLLIVFGSSTEQMVNLCLFLTSLFAIK